MSEEKTSTFFVRKSIEVIVIGVVAFIIQFFVQKNFAPQIAAETAKQENLISDKREVYKNAAQLMNRQLAATNFRQEGKWYYADSAAIANKPTEMEMNNCISNLFLYTDNKDVIVMLKRFFTDSTYGGIGTRDYLLWSIRNDLIDDRAPMKIDTSEKMYIRQTKRR